MRTWRLNGSPRQGPICDYKNGTKPGLKALCALLRQMRKLRREASANKTQLVFWENIKKINHSNVSLPSVINGVCGTNK